jgi:hypothetical protein
MADAIAVYGALVASAAIAWNIFNYVNDRGQLRIDAALARISLKQEFDPVTITTTVTKWLDVLAVTASNIGRRPMTIGQCVLEGTHGRSQIYLSGGTLRYGPQAGFPLDESHKVPKRLSDGESHTYYFPVEGLIQTIPGGHSSKPDVVVVKDGTGKEWRSPLSKDVIEGIEWINALSEKEPKA